LEGQGQGRHFNTAVANVDIARMALAGKRPRAIGASLQTTTVGSLAFIDIYTNSVFNVKTLLAYKFASGTSGTAVSRTSSKEKNNKV